MAGLEVQDNLFTSILMVEAADVEALPDADPAAGQRRLAVGTDHILYLISDAGVKTAVGGGFSGDAGDIPFTPAAGIAATDVQAAIEEVVSDAAAKYSPDRAPTSGLTLSDEFDDSSLDGAWTWDTAPGGTVSESTYPGFLYLTGGTDASGTVRLLRRAFVPGAAAFSVAAKMNLATDNGNFSTQIGIRVVDSSDATIWLLIIAGDGTATTADGYRIISTASTWITAATVPLISAPQYLLITRSAANVYKGYISVNGVAWQYVGTSTVATTVSKVCITYGVDTDALDDDASVDFVRVFTTETKKIGA